MAIDWQSSELYFPQQIDEGAGGESRVRGWYVDATPEEAQASPGAPSVGESHPSVTGLVVQNVSFVPQGVGTSVRASYVPTEFSGGPPPENIQDDDYVSIDSTFEDVEVDIPVYQVVVKLLSNGQGIQPILQTTYQPVENKARFFYTRAVHRVTLNVGMMVSATVPAQIQLVQNITDQANKIHTIGGTDLLFKPDNIRRFNAEKRQFTYRWVSDPGVPNTLAPFEEVLSNPAGNGQLGRIGSYLFPHADNDFIIPPFNRLDTAPGEVDGSQSPNVAPVVRVNENHERDAQGYLSLPGV